METSDLRTHLLPIFQRHKILKAILFGSLARGEASKRSDVDLILIKQTRQRFFDRYDTILYELNNAIPDHQVDVLIYTPKELKQISGRAFIAQALREGKILYESK